MEVVLCWWEVADVSSKSYWFEKVFPLSVFLLPHLKVVLEKKSIVTKLERCTSELYILNVMLLFVLVVLVVVVL